MISIIICSKNPAYLNALTQNISETIGISYELLAFDNRLSKKGIAAVYNSQAAKARYETLCFVHEDIVIHTVGWGMILKNLLANKSVGLVGISGAVFKSKYPGIWSSCETNLYRTNSIQHFKNSIEPVITNINPENATHENVVVIDGVFMATRKNIFLNNKFDEILLKGFHGYDIDYSIQIGQQYKVLVSFEILIEHLSEGILSPVWLKDSIHVHKKWSKALPLQSNLLAAEQIHLNDYLAMQNLMSVALKYKGNKKIVLLNYLKLIFLFRKYNRFKFSKSVCKYLIDCA